MEAFLNHLARPDAARIRFLPGLGHEALDHARHGAPFGMRTRCKIPSELGVEVLGLAAGGVEPAVRCQVGMHGHEPAFQSDRADEVKEEGLPGAVLADHETDRGATVRDPLEVTE